MNALEVLAPGGLCLVQDLGRLGYMADGVAVAGAADLGAHALAQRLCGNAPSAAGLEVLMGGLRVRAAAPFIFAVTGAEVDVTVDGIAVGRHVAVVAAPGAVVALGRPARGLRSYLAVRGGIDVPMVLGSRSRDTLGGLGPPPVVAEDLLPIGGAVVGDAWFDVVPVRERGHDLIAVLRPGPHDDLLDAAGWQHLADTVWTVDAASNRIGTRLAGPPLPAPSADLPSFAVVPGCVQLPGNGLPIVLGPDAGVTGGYPVLGLLGRDDLDAFAQLRPGDAVRLRRGR